MSLKIFVLLLVAGIALAKVDEFGNEDEAPEKQESPVGDEETKMVVEDMNTETSTALVQNDAHDPDTIKHKGFCHWGIAVWYKPGVAIRCSCMKCVCGSGGNWACAYEFAYCPYYYCGNQIYNPATQICCCGKVHTKKANGACCGYFYYDTRVSQCCNYYSVKPKKAKCPRYRV